MILLAIVAQVLPVKAVIPVHGVVQLGSNTSRAAVMLKDVDWRYVLWFALGSILGAVVGGQLVISLPLDLLRATLGLFILATIWSPSFTSKLASRKTLFVGGSLSTVLTMFVGATGPFVMMLIRAFDLPKMSLVATSAACLVLQHGLKIAVFGMLGFAFAPYLPLIVLMVASGFIGTLVGRKLLIKIDEPRFQRWLNIILSLLAVRLLLVALY